MVRTGRHSVAGCVHTDRNWYRIRIDLRAGVLPLRRARATCAQHDASASPLQSGELCVAWQCFPDRHRGADHGPHRRHRWRGRILLAVRWGYKALRKRDGMGLGDVKLLAMIAAFLGFGEALLALFAGTLAPASMA